MTGGTGIPPGTEAAPVGVLRVGPVPVAVPLDELREVLPCPEQLDPLPAPTSGTGLLGATNLRGSVLPVLDLRPLLGWPAERQRDQIVAVVARGDRFLGVLCDEVLGVSRPPAGTVQRLDDAGGGLLFTHSFERPANGAAEAGIVSLLDVERLFELTGMPVAHGLGAVDAAAARAQAGGDAAVGAEQVLVRCGEIRFALDVQHVHALLPSVALTASPLAGALCVGVTRYAGRQVAAIDLLRLLGLGNAMDRATGGLILRFGDRDAEDGEGFVALLLSEVIELVRVADGRLMELPAVMSAGAEWFRGIASHEQVGDFLVLDPDRLASDPELAGLAALNVHDDPAGAMAGGVPAQRDGLAGDAADQPGTAGTRYLTYSAGGEHATPLLQISEIIAVPPAPTPIRAGEPAMLGIFTFRGSVLPLVCLPTLLGRPPQTDPLTDPASRVLVVAVEHGQVGFVVPLLRAIETSTWEEEATPPDGPPATPAEAAAVSHVVRVGAEGESRNLRTLDLALVAEVLSRRVGATTAGR